ncbi:endonuclease VII domain-containing protein [Kocuria kalidii]|uniref:endonuclease VII domain-containing protein n=1 Tax=Kocuria kalidii TaxID=3376283 RepID=UPI00379BF572
MKSLHRAVSYKECPAPGCTRDARTKEFCSGHMQQLRRGIPRKQMTPLRIRAPRKRTRPRGAVTERDAAGNKECSRCQGWKSEDAYTKNRQTPDGLEPRCRQCAKEERAARTNKRDRFLRRLYEMTEEQFNLILDHQGGACAICQRTADEAHPKGDPLHVDHDHACCPELPACGKCNRGLLCSDCNRGLGVFRESVEAFRGAVLYLQRPNITRQQLSDWATTNETVKGTGVNAAVSDSVAEPKWNIPRLF